MGTTDLGMSRKPVWWRLVGALQMLLLVALIGGAIWLIALSVIATLGFTAPAAPEVGVLGVPALLVLAGLFLPPLVAMIARSVAVRRARKARARAEAALNDAVTAVARERVLAPIRAELRVYAQLRDALAELSRS